MPIDVVTTRYGAPAYASLREAVAAAKARDALAPVTVVVPDERTGVTARRALARGLGATGRPGVAALTLVTVRRLAEHTVGNAVAASGRRPLTSPLLAAHVRRALAADPGLFGPVAQHPGTVSALAAAHRQLRALDDQTCERLASHGPLVADVIRLHRQVRARWKDLFFDEVDLLESAAEAIRAAGGPTGSTVVFLPQDLDPPETALLHALRGDVTVIVGATGDDRADAVVLGPWRATPTSSAHPAVGDRVLHATDADDEVRAVVREVTRALHTTVGHRIAVFYGSADPYARLLHEHLAAADVTVHGRGVTPVSERVLPRALLRLLALPDRDYRRDDVLGVIADAPVHWRGRRAPATIWERISRSSGVVAGTDWRRLADRAKANRLAAAAERSDREGQAWRADRDEREAKACDALLGFVDDLRARLERIDKATCWRELQDEIQRLWREVLRGEDMDHYPEQQRLAADRVSGLLGSLGGLDVVDDPPSPRAVRELLDLELDESLDRVGRTGIGVHVAPLSDAVGSDVDLVLIVGMAEGLLPTRRGDDPLLPDEARALTAGALPTTRDRIARQHRQLLAALAGAPEGGRVLSFPRGDLRRGGERVPSRWLLPTLRALTCYPGLQATTWTRTPSSHVVELPSHAAALQRCDVLASAQEWRLRAAAAGVDTGDSVLARARETQRARASAEFTRFDGNLTQVDTLPDPTTGRSISPTALQSYVECPHGYFLRHLLGVNPVDIPEELVSISPLDIGVRVHRMLERFIDEALDRWPLAPHQPWPPDAHARLLEIAEEECECAEADGITGFPLLWERDKATILADLAGVLTADDARRARYGVVPWRTELPFGTGGTEPVRLGLGDGRVLMLRGMADRIDRAPSGGRIVVIDYKTGSIRPYRHLGATDPTHAGRRLQLPVYALAARAAVGDHTAPVRAEYWFPNRRSNYEDIGYEVSDDILDETRRVLRVIVDGISGGLFPARPVKDADAYSCDWCDIAGHPGVGSRWERKKAAEPLASYLALITGTSA